MKTIAQTVGVKLKSKIMEKHKYQPLWRDHYELIRDTKSIKYKLKFNFWIIDHFIYKKPCR